MEICYLQRFTKLISPKTERNMKPKEKTELETDGVRIYDTSRGHSLTALVGKYLIMLGLNIHKLTSSDSSPLGRVRVPAVIQGRGEQFTSQIFLSLTSKFSVFLLCFHMGPGTPGSVFQKVQSVFPAVPAVFFRGTVLRGSRNCLKRSSSQYISR